MADLDLDRLEALARAATPGPWRPTFTGDGEYGGQWDVWADAMADDMAVAVLGEDEASHYDSAFIAAADPSTVLALIARLREAEDAMNVCARCGETIDAEVQAEEARSSASSIRHAPDPYAEAKRLRQEPVVDLMAALEASLAAAKAAQAARAKKQAEEADAATPTPSTDNAR